MVPPLFSLSLEHLPRWFGYCGSPEFESEFTATLVSCSLLYMSLNVFFIIFDHGLGMWSYSSLTRE